MKLSGKMVTVYHVSPEANITQFQSRYSPKNKARGLFVTPSYQSIISDWSGYVASKKYPRGERSNGYYQNLTVYTLQIPDWALAQAREFHDKAYEAAKARVSKEDEWKLYGAWGWGPEVFVPEPLVETIKIVGRETFRSRELWAEKSRGPREDEDNSFLGRAQKVRGTNPAARKFIETKEKLQTLVLQKKIEPDLIKQIEETSSKLVRMFWEWKDHSRYNPLSLERLDDKHKGEFQLISKQLKELFEKAEEIMGP